MYLQNSVEEWNKNAEKEVKEKKIEELIKFLTRSNYWRNK
jgi:hypothetical protein